MAAARELKRGINYQPLSAAQAQVRVDESNCQRPLPAHAPRWERASCGVQDAAFVQPSSAPPTIVDLTPLQECLLLQYARRLELVCALDDAMIQSSCLPQVTSRVPK